MCFMSCHFKCLKPERTLWGIQFSSTNQDWPTSLEASIRESCGSERYLPHSERNPFEGNEDMTGRERVFTIVWAAKASVNQTNDCTVLQMCRITVFFREIPNLITAPQLGPSPTQE